jgi:hypothetical protein
MIRFLIAIPIILVAWCGVSHAAPEVPGRAPDHPVALVGGTLHPVSGPDVAGGVLVIDAGKIVAIGGSETPSGSIWPAGTSTPA